MGRGSEKRRRVSEFCAVCLCCVYVCVCARVRVRVPLSVRALHMCTYMRMDMCIQI